MSSKSSLEALSSGADGAPSMLNRRRLLGGGGAFAAASVLGGWLPCGQVLAAQASQPVPGGFPSHLPLFLQVFRNWAQDVVVEDVWTCVPRTPEDVVLICNWARLAGFKVRPRGNMHNWSPLTVAPGARAPRVILLDMGTCLNQVSIKTTSTGAAVTAQCGVQMQALLTRMEDRGLGFTATPAPGDLTLGGVLAIDGHGTAIPAAGERRQAGQSYGSLSNAVLALTAVVFDAARDCYVLRRFRRDEPAIGPLLAHVGRAFIVEATLQAGKNQKLRCRSFMNVSADELFAPKGAGGRTFASYVEAHGRAEAIWFPFTRYPWMKVWSVAPNYPLPARIVTQPFNYPFSDNLPVAASNLIQRIVSGEGHLTPAFGAMEASISAVGLAGTLSLDLWGASKNLLLYVKPSTLRVTANGYAILTRRADIQRVVHDFCLKYEALLEAYRSAGRYPANGPVEIRVTGLDRPSEVDLPGAVVPSLSAVRPRDDHPEWDVAVWLDILTFPGTPGAAAFYREVEQWMFAHFQGWCGLRVEWSKGWGYSASGAWSDNAMLDEVVPRSFREGVPVASSWDASRARLAAFDPYRLFSSPLNERLLG